MNNPEVLALYQIDEKMAIHRELVTFIAENPEVRGVITQEMTEDGVYIAEGIDENSPEVRWLGQIVSLKALIGPELSAADSINCVSFYSAAVRREEGGEVEFIDVAVKPNTPDSPSPSLINEYNASIKADKRGFNVFKPLAMIKIGETTFLVTEYRNDVLTLDNFDLTIHPDPAL